MENLEIILALAGTAFSTLVACATFVIKFIKSVKQRLKEQGTTYLLDAVAPIVESAEAMKNYTGAEKKEYVMTKANQYAIENKIEFDADAVSWKIEQLVSLTKQVNQRDSDKQKKESASI